MKVNLGNLTRGEVLANRRKWIDFLKVKGRKKAIGVLDAGGGKRCCLGHGCYILDINRSKFDDDEYSSGDGFYYEGQEDFPPESFITRVGLWEYNGGNPEGQFYDDEAMFETLSCLNDDAGWSPLKIAKYLETVIEGGPSTPFIQLSKYPK